MEFGVAVVLVVLQCYCSTSLFTAMHTHAHTHTRPPTHNPTQMSVMASHCSVTQHGLFTVQPHAYTLPSL